ncbi:MAG: hypothetical protein NVS3B20_17340 [Polyangiales bacterium]
MTSELQLVDDDFERCAYCARPAAGPCATCQKLVCGECCVLTEGVSVWAVCLRCHRTGNTALKEGWRALIRWLLLMIVGLFLCTVALLWLLR